MRSQKTAEKKPVKGVKMKASQLAVKKKKINLTKEMEASISETISSVIKAKPGSSKSESPTTKKVAANAKKKKASPGRPRLRNLPVRKLEVVKKVLPRKKLVVKKDLPKVTVTKRATRVVKKVPPPKVTKVKPVKSKDKKAVPEKKVKKIEESKRLKLRPSKVEPMKTRAVSNVKPKTIIKHKILKRQPLKKPVKIVKPIKKEKESSPSVEEEQPPKEEPKKTQVVVKKAKAKYNTKSKVNEQRKMKLYNFWNGPKRHRVASLNALAKVHCLYENESRSHLLDQMDIKPETVVKRSSPSPSPPLIKTENEASTRTLRCVPGLRAVGKMWDMHDTTSSSEDFSEAEYEPEKERIKEREKNKEKEKNREKAREKAKEKEKEKEELAEKDEDADEIEEVKREEKKPVKKRKRTELIMDLKDMVVRKRMASLNASAILAASYSVEKRGFGGYSDSETDSETSEEYNSDEGVRTRKRTTYESDVKKEEIIEVRATPNKKVSVILNQDTDVTITGVYVNSTTRSTHHEGYCSIAGMQYRISATSHTQTAATAVATETILQSSSSTTTQENTNIETPPSKSYTPLDALSNMQPPAGTSSSGVPLGHHHLPPHSQMSPLGRRGHGCPSSAFSAPPCGSHLPPTDHGYMQGYYQPAGPLISVPHGHSQPPIGGKSVPLSESSPSAETPPIHQPPPPSSAGDSSDSEVIITSVTTAKEASSHQQQQQQQHQQAVPPPPPPQQYRLSHYPQSPAYPYGFSPQYYSAPPPAPAYAHDICYPPYKLYGRYHRFPPQYYSPASPEMYNPAPQSSTNQQVVSATPASNSSSYPAPAPGGPSTLIETYPTHHAPIIEASYQPPPPSHFYSGYAPSACYTHPTPTRPLNYTTYQSCPCPMQSCSKNGLTGPLAGISKRSNISIAKESVPLPPVALALPQEPASATGPPSPARGSAGMPPPPSPAGATYQPPPPKQETPGSPDLQLSTEKRRKARVGKAMVRNTIANNNNTMLLMCQQPTFLENVKREVESPKETTISTTITATTTDLKKIGEIAVEKPDVVVRKEEPVKVEIPPEPCQKTVAETVKVKNMKRKLSLKESPKSETADSPPKQTKTIQEQKANGSYKDLIKKTPCSIVKINNGKRKLITDGGRKLFHRMRLKKANKRKLLNGKRFRQHTKTSTPLSASSHNAKQNLKLKRLNKRVQEAKSNVDKTIDSVINEVCSTSSATDNNNVRSNVDRTIDSVVSEISRTGKVAADTAPALRIDKCKKEAEASLLPSTATKKSVKTTAKGHRAEAVKSAGKRTTAAAAAKSKEVFPQPLKAVPRRSAQLRWSNGWRWEGEPFESKVFLNSDAAVVSRNCYPAMRHEEGDIIRQRDCVLLKAGPRKNDLPYVAKIASLWENPDDGEMMMSLLWYYRPEHTEHGRQPTDQSDEVFASRHKDSNSVACIEDKCYVLTFNEYCRYRKKLRRVQEGVEDAGPCIPKPELYPRDDRQPPISLQMSPDLVFFCRRVYDFRQKRIVKNPS
ncbi:PREDICTED: bromodomain-containing protein 4 isoform X2 [Nicrophorus vespilloides]|uniref:Bromodomain-containing protein 4 isoform X2 n=1 Tax=Nicrophorus vespilloides TaxID=110193 RepID=A0ABM1NC74_NICVS|nr:PREDICTED: bromodomain-containing protein 4 isoform X2 [Nicrophorus vespilloides]